MSGSWGAGIPVLRKASQQASLLLLLERLPQRPRQVFLPASLHETSPRRLEVIRFLSPLHSELLKRWLGSSSQGNNEFLILDVVLQFILLARAQASASLFWQVPTQCLQEKLRLRQQTLEAPQAQCPERENLNLGSEGPRSQASALSFEVQWTRWWACFHSE